MRFILLLIIAVFAILAGVAVIPLLNKNPSAPQAAAPQNSGRENVATVDVLVAKQAVPLGAIITEAMVEKQPWPEHLVLDNFVVSGNKNADIIGKVAREPFQEREPFTSNKLANPNDPSFLAANLPAGMRAITLATDTVSGIAGYLFPGDRVDVIFTHNLPQEIKQVNQGTNRTAERPAVTEVLAPNLRVLAVNLREVVGKETTQSNTTPTSITLETSDEDAQKIRLAEKLGTVSLSLRSLKDNNGQAPVQPTLPAPTQLGTLSKVHLETGPNANSPIRIIRGVGAANDDKLGDAAAPPAAAPNALTPNFNR